MRARVSANDSVVMDSGVWFSKLDVDELLERANALSDLSDLTCMSSSAKANRVRERYIQKNERYY